MGLTPLTPLVGSPGRQLQRTQAPIVVVSGANTPDGKLLEPTLAAIPIERPDPQTTPQHLCLDKAYSGEPCTTVAEEAGYTVHVPDKANAKKNASASLVGARPVGG